MLVSSLFPFLPINSHLKKLWTPANRMHSNKHFAATGLFLNFIFLLRILETTSSYYVPAAANSFPPKIIFRSTSQQSGVQRSGVFGLFLRNERGARWDVTGGCSDFVVAGKHPPAFYSSMSFQLSRCLRCVCFNGRGCASRISRANVLCTLLGALTSLYHS